MTAFSKSFSVLLALFVATSQAANLRRGSTIAIKNDAAPKNEESQDQRKLQLAAGILNSLINVFTPLMVNTIQDRLDETLDPYVVGAQQIVELGGNDRRMGILDCDASATFTYGVANIVGLSSFDFNRMELIPGSENIDMSFMGLDGADWIGTWLLNATFPALTAETTISIAAEACGFPIEQTLTAMATLHNPNLQGQVRLGGNTSNLLQFAQSSQVTTTNIESMDFSLGEIEVVITSSGSVIPQFELGETFNAFMVNEFSDQIEPVMMTQLNAGLVTQLPFSLNNINNNPP